MGWGKFDDRYPSNRKVRPLSDAAFRLDVSAILWSSANLTDGCVPEDELHLASDVKQPAKAAAELVRRGRWHLAGEGCGTETCWKGEPGDGWQIHDYFDHNDSKAKIMARRAADNRRKKGGSSGPDSARNPSGIQPEDDPESSRNPSGLREDASRARPQPVPSRPVPSDTQVGSSALEPIANEHAAAALGPLRERLEAARLVVRWDKLTAEQADHIAELIDVHGEAALVAAARRAWQQDNPPAFAQAWLGAWDALPVPRMLRAVDPICAEHALATPCISCAADRKAAP